MCRASFHSGNLIPAPKGMPSVPVRAHLTSVRPPAACPGGRLTLVGSGFAVDGPQLPTIQLGEIVARPSRASSSSITVAVPSELPGGPTNVRVEGAPGETAVVEIGAPLATGLHQVDNPVFDAAGRLCVTCSGARGQQVPVSIYRIGRDGTRETFVTGLVNATSMTRGPDGALYVSSRFEGTVYRVDDSGQATPVVTDVGVASGLAFAADGTLYIGDRSGTIFRARPGGQATMVASLPASVAAFHLAMGPDGWLYVSAPTLTSHDRIYRVHRDGGTEVVYSGFGRPQGLAFDASGTLHVVEALAGASGLYRLPLGGSPELLISGEALVGVAFDPHGGLVLSSADTVYRFGAG
jgi:hypothetical protein